MNLFFAMWWAMWGIFELLYAFGVIEQGIGSIHVICACAPASFFYFERIFNQGE